MEYNHLKQTYWTKQCQRVLATCKQLGERLAVTAGRTVPDSDDLAIGNGRRLSAAVMFIDISGFTSRPSESEGEQLTQLAALNLFFTEMIRIAEDYGGTVEKNTGDGLMVYFEDGGNDPPENGSHRAVACALTMMEANQKLIKPILERSDIPALGFRVCIDHGSITIAKMGAAKRFTSIVAVGTTANISSKMLSLAKEGEILIGANVRSQLPLAWSQKFTTLHTSQTGFVFKTTNLPYSYYLYTGRWSRLVK